MANSWLRLWHDMPNDPKWRTIAKASQQPIPMVISVYVHLLVDASANATERGRTQPNAEDLASALDVETECVTSVLSAMDGRVIEAGRLSGWDRRQPEKEDGSADRARLWRKKQKEIKGQPNATERNRTPTNTDKDKDKDKIKTKAQAKDEPSLFMWPEWIEQDAVKDFEEMRRKKRAPLTDRARKNIVAELVRLEATGQHAEDVLNQSITNSWSGVFPLKNEGGGNGGVGSVFGNRGQQRTDGNIAAAKRAAAVIRGEDVDGAGGGAASERECGDVEAVCGTPGRVRG
jgi:hypothetical protein